MKFSSTIIPKFFKFGGIWLIGNLILGDVTKTGNHKIIWVRYRKKIVNNTFREAR